MNDAQQTFYYLSVALAVGLLIGVERGWKAREAKAGERVAGVRTYGLIGLLGGVERFESLAALLSDADPAVRGVGAAALADLGDARAIPLLEHETRG